MKHSGYMGECEGAGSPNKNALIPCFRFSVINNNGIISVVNTNALTAKYNG